MIGAVVVEESAVDERAPVEERWGRDPGLVRRELRAFAELFALCGLAVAQPLLDIFGRAPQQFAFRGVEGRAIVLFAVVVTFVPPVFLWVVEAAVDLFSTAVRQVLHLLLVAVLVVLFGLQLVAPWLGGVPRAVVAAALGAGAGWLHRRVAPARTWLAFMAVAPVVFLALFLVASPTAGLLNDPDAVALDAGVGSPAPVVMVVFDELPLTSLITADGEIDADLYPNFAGLAEGSHWFRNTTTVSSSTWYAVPALLTGQMVADGPAPIAADHPESLFTLLGDVYDLNVTESVTRVCPADICEVTAPEAGGGRQLLGDAIDVWTARVSWSGPGADPVAGLVEPEVEAAGEEPPSEDEDEDEDEGESEESPFADFSLNQPARLDTFAEGVVDDRAALHYLHVLLPHVPYRYLPSGARYSGPDPDLGRIDDDWSDQAWLADLGRQRHLLQVGYVDALLGDIVEMLRSKGVYDDALLIVTSDHGISFEAGGPIRGIGGQDLDGGVLADVAWVPLFVKEPGQQTGSVSDENTSTLDVLPTVADVLEVETPWEVDGTSLLGPPREEVAKPFRPSEVHAFGVSALDPVDVSEASGFDVVVGRGVDRFLSSGDGQARWWSLGPQPELVGHPSHDVGSEVEADLVEPGGFDLAAGAERVPALIRGGVEGLEPDDPLAVSVNGVVAATGLAYLEGDDTVFAVIVSDEHFVVGENTVTVHRLDP